ncbi:vacuolar protein sorting-associated protein 33B [Lutzomyia longipalpis]|uniref:vacuolar protein sorting-associated protein 33B n=1 Tax=Lutzomyia longipalpis TaxID=7200 RepID=UPI00248407A7|nr:vacuolar protein sorting-associated protein 33B [Lutzomyia longipalpis]
MNTSVDKKLLGFRQIAIEKLQHILFQIPGSRKDLVIEGCLIKPLEHICGVSWLRAKGIEKIFKFEQTISPPVGGKVFIYFISANLLIFKQILDQIHSFGATGAGPRDGDVQFHVIVLPNLLHSQEELLEQEGLCGFVQLHRFNWDFISLDSGVLSLEIPDVFRDVFIRHDTTSLLSISQSIRLFRMVCGQQKILLTYGSNSEKIAQMVRRIEEHRPSSRDEGTTDFAAAFIVDRSKDFASCLLTPVTYSGLLLEIHQAKSGSLIVEAKGSKIRNGKFSLLEEDPPAADAKATNLRMNSSLDGIFAENKYRHFSEVITLLSAQAKALGMEGQFSRDMKIHEMKQYVTEKLPRVAAAKKELFKHLTLCETIMKDVGSDFEQLQDLQDALIYGRNRRQAVSQIEDNLATDAHKFNTLRLICLLHLTSNLSTEEATQFITNYCNVFGHRHLTVFHNLSQCGLFPEISPESSSLTARSKLLSNIPLSKKPQNALFSDAAKMKLLPEMEASGNPREGPTCPSYVFNGTYIPLVAQVASILLKAESFEDVALKLGQCDGLGVSVGKADQVMSIREAQSVIKRSEVSDPFPLRPRTVFIFVLGGVTYAEIAACHLVEKLTGSKIVLASNTIVSGSEIIGQAF